MTAHWLTEKFERMWCILNVIPLEEFTLELFICTKIKSCLEKWKIKGNQVHVFVRDNGTNMVKAINDADFTGQECFAHTLQLVVHDGVLSQCAVLDLLSVSRRIVGHFKHSTAACSALCKIQENLGLPHHTLKQDIQTRWNSTYYMLNSILEQKMALAAYSTENSIPILTTHQLDLASKVVQVLAPIEEITQMISAEAACISMIIPLVRGLMKTLEKHNQDSGVRTMRAEMLASLKHHFADIEKEEHLVLATILDPCYKNKLINNQDATTEILKEKYHAQVSAASDKTEQPPSQQEMSTNQEKQSDLWESVTEMLEESGVNFIGEVNELSCYLDEPLIDVRKGNPYKWWHNNMS